ncbi:hypothetical protein KTH_32190 [Thermosporothrix hazakensis]|nr:hypothetical protein KTH_32190 [Thermosporothrix hazakensis]
MREEKAILNVRWFKKNPYTYSMILIVVLATLFRCILLAFNWPTTNSDEGNLGIAGMRIAFHGELPIFFYGQAYMGPVESYLAAPLFRLFGPSLFTLRFSLILMYAGFLIGTYFLVRLLYTERYALASVLLLSFGSPEVILRLIKAVGEYPEMTVAAPFILLIATKLALTAPTRERPSPMVPWKRYMLFALLGVIFGVILWVDLIILPFVVTASIFLLIFCWREARSWPLLCIIGGLLLGLFPMIYYNISLLSDMKVFLEQNSVSVLLHMHGVSDGVMAEKHLTLLHQLLGSIMIALPLATGAYPSCPDQDWILFGHPTSATIGCSIASLTWGIVFLLLMALATILAIVAVWRHRAIFRSQDAEKRELFILKSARVMVLLSACLTFGQYITSTHGAVYPVTSARYLSCLLDTMPAIFWPVWVGAGRLFKAINWKQRALGIVSSILLAILFVTFVRGTIGTIRDVPDAYRNYQQRDRLVNHLLSIGATRIYSEYWTCNDLIFHSKEQIICSVLYPNLRPGLTRYRPYQAMVDQAPVKAYIFPKSAEHLKALEKKMQGTNYKKEIFEDRYVIYYIPQ